jgi:homoserine kinase
MYLLVPLKGTTMSIKPEVPALPEIDPIQLHKIITIPEVQELTSLSRDVLEKNYRHLFVYLSAKRVGMRLGHALQISSMPAEQRKRYRRASE